MLSNLSFLWSPALHPASTVALVALLHLSPALECELLKAKRMRLEHVPRQSRYSINIFNRLLYCPLVCRWQAKVLRKVSSMTILRVDEIPVYSQSNTHPSLSQEPVFSPWGAEFYGISICWVLSLLVPSSCLSPSPDCDSTL